MDNEAQIDSLTHAIKKGRLKYSLHLTMVMLVGLGILKSIFGNGLDWLCSSAWIWYIALFAFIYFMMWPVKLGRAKNEIGEREAEKIVISQGARDNSWFVSLVILVALFALTMFGGQGADEMEEQGVPVEMKIASSTGEEMTLEIPQSYINEEMSDDFEMSFTEEDFIESVMTSAKLDTIEIQSFQDIDVPQEALSSANFESTERYSFSQVDLPKETTLSESIEEFEAKVFPDGDLSEGAAASSIDFDGAQMQAASEEEMPQSVILSAKLDDVGLTPFSPDQEAPYKEHQISPRTNPEMVAIEVDPVQVKITEEYLDAVFDQMTRGTMEDVPVSEVNGLDVRTTRVKVPNTQMRGFVEVDEVKLGVPTDPSLKHVFVACENKVCSLNANVKDGYDAHLYFHPSRFGDWEEIYWEMDQLLKGFAQELPEEQG